MFSKALNGEGNFVMDKKNFHAVVDAIFSDFSDQIEDQVGDVLEVEHQGDQVHIQDEATGRSLLLSKQEPRLEIWAASSLSGAHHFFFDPVKKQWLSTRDPALDFFTFIEREVSELAQKNLTLN